jgi:hypothetical protein
MDPAKKTIGVDDGPGRGDGGLITWAMVNALPPAAAQQSIHLGLQNDAPSAYQGGPGESSPHPWADGGVPGVWVSLDNNTSHPYKARDGPEAHEHHKDRVPGGAQQ